jgi:hypothetical protein
MNSKKALGLTIPLPLLARADEVRITVISPLGMSLSLAQDCRCGMSALTVAIRGERTKYAHSETFSGYRSATLAAPADGWQVGSFAEGRH